MILFVFLIFAKISFLSITSPHKTMFLLNFIPCFSLLRTRSWGWFYSKARVKNGVYTLPDLLMQASLKMVANVHERTSINGWHKCLGHPSKKIVHHLVKNFSLPIIQEEHSSIFVPLVLLLKHINNHFGPIAFKAMHLLI